MRFAWLLEQAGEERNESIIGRSIFVLYNLVYWIPVVLPLFGEMDYQTSFVIFVLINVFRTFANAYRINLMPIEQAQVFPLRAP